MDVDFHALAPEIILASTVLIVLVVDVFLPERAKWRAMPIGCRCARAWWRRLVIGAGTRCFRRPYVVDEFALLFKVFFPRWPSWFWLSLRYFREGGFYQGEYDFLLLTSFLGT